MREVPVRAQRTPQAPRHHMADSRQKSYTESVISTIPRRTGLLLAKQLIQPAFEFQKQWKDFNALLNDIV